VQNLRRSARGLSKKKGTRSARAVAPSAILDCSLGFQLGQVKDVDAGFFDERDQSSRKRTHALKRAHVLHACRSSFDLIEAALVEASH